MTKQEKIQEAYGEHWETVKDYVDKKGWLNKKVFEETNLRYEDLNTICLHANGWCLPDSLQGIETNNGWTQLKGIKNEIQHDGDIWIFNKNGNIELWLENQFLPLNYATHWKPIIKPKPPIY